MKKKIIIFKNDRGGDLLNSIQCISSLLNNQNDVTIFLSNYNISFLFLFKNAKVKKINYDLNFFDRIYLFFFILFNKFDEIYILTPKNYYFFLPIIFRNIKFYGLTVKGVKRNRPINFLRKFLHKFITIDRQNINIISSSNLQLKLIDKTIPIDISCKNLNQPKLDDYLYNNLPKNFTLIQFKEIFFNKIDLTNDNFFLLLNQLNNKFRNIVLFSDIEKTNSNDFFIKNLDYINCNNKKIYFKSLRPNIIYLHDINIENLFSLTKIAENILCPHGLLTHMGKFYNKKTLNLFNFEINNKSDLLHQKIAFSEWYKGKDLEFILLNKDRDRTIRKILKFF